MGTAYFRVVPSRSRSSDIVIAEPSASRSRDAPAQLALDLGVEEQLRVDLDDAFLVAEQGEQVGDGGPRVAGGGGELGRVGRAHARPRGSSRPARS